MIEIFLRLFSSRCVEKGIGILTIILLSGHAVHAESGAERFCLKKYPSYFSEYFARRDCVLEQREIEKSAEERRRAEESERIREELARPWSPMTSKEWRLWLQARVRL